MVYLFHKSISYISAVVLCKSSDRKDKLFVDYFLLQIKPSLLLCMHLVVSVVSNTNLKCQVMAQLNKYFCRHSIVCINYLLFEIGGSIGLMNCLTDIGGNKGLGKKSIKDINVNEEMLVTCN